MTQRVNPAFKTIKLNTIHFVEGYLICQKIAIMYLLFSQENKKKMSFIKNVYLPSHQFIDYTTKIKINGFCEDLIWKV